MKRIVYRLAALLLILTIALPCGGAFGEEADEAEKIIYIATSTAMLKVRIEPDKDARGVDNVEKGADVFVLLLGSEWSKIRASRNVGYVMTKYLTDLREYDEATQTAGAAVNKNEVVAKVTAEVDSENGFIEKYQAYAYTGFALYESPSDSSRRIVNVPMHEKLTVGTIEGEWCHVKYKRTYGWVQTKCLFKWDRIDPYAGDIPGLVCYPLMIFVKRSTSIYSTEDDSVLKTINPGSATCSLELDEKGRYVVPYWRTTGYIKEEDVAYSIPVRDWENAEPGDLISVMTTFYAVGITTLQYQGRNWNIYLSTSMISGTVLQPGETYNQRDVIGPYLKSTGYHKAPIQSAHALWGYGGGTCQVNTTFYICSIQLPLLITHRKVHADVGIYYCPVGFDAAVGGGDINLTMVNTLPYAIRYQFFMSDGVLTACIFRES